MRGLARGAVTLAVLLGAWQGLVWLTGLPRYLLPGPLAVAEAMQRQAPLLLQHGLTTLTEILLGLVGGVVLGSLSALTLARFRAAQRWLMPLLVVSQAIPVFALAPLLVLWLGYGMASKIAMAVLIIYFPVTTALFDGLRRTDPGWLDLARTMGATPAATLWAIRLPAALPAFWSGVRVAAAVAPIGAVIGEWVGSSSGLGYLMLHANARMQIDLLFAAVLVLGLFAVALYAAVNALARRALPWQSDTQPAGGLNG
ncbi:putative hydroxymethylpyrimidine transport system permease protein [Azospirillum agricola]|uniref:ABC transporter permease n=1 Tax=Azospirillum agricola TaxID=1720247 RepID=UPI001AE7D0A4|nr:ABC transporter permease [Azospirillum agricola]MBP2227392.1 putative hydroxymethylpyrimidine transport system permease protein [Azospirillum agricola]